MALLKDSNGIGVEMFTDYRFGAGVRYSCADIVPRGKVGSKKRIATESIVLDSR